MKNFLAALIISPLLALTIAMSLYKPSPERLSEAAEERRQIKEDSAITAEVRLCLEKSGPWKCFQVLKKVDDDYPVKRGDSRILRFASMSTARAVLEFCDLPRKVDCANLMFGSGYEVGEVRVALKSFE